MNAPTSETCFAIKHDNGTYFVSMTAIGPMFGGRLRGKDMTKAALYKSKVKAEAVVSSSWWKFDGARVVKVKR